MRTERYELRDDPCAAGKWRGGVGMVRVNRFLEDTIVTCEGDRCESDPPWGIFGGHDGTLAYGKVTSPDGTVELWPAKFTGKVLKAGSTIEIAVPNSGGYGDPLERDPAHVERDVANRYVSREAAASLYGVAVGEDGAVDAEETDRLRAAERAARAAWRPVAEIAEIEPVQLSSEATGEPELSVHEYLVVRDHEGHRILACNRCDHTIADYRGNYKAGLLADTQPLTLLPHVIDPQHFLDEDMVLRRYCCPGCQTLMSVEVVRRSEPPVSEFALA
jgi:hypothetical protein